MNRYQTSVLAGALAVTLLVADPSRGQSAGETIRDEISYTNDIRPIVNYTSVAAVDGLPAPLR